MSLLVSVCVRETVVCVFILPRLKKTKERNVYNLFSTVVCSQNSSNYGLPVIYFCHIFVVYFL